MHFGIFTHHCVSISLISQGVLSNTVLPHRFNIMTYWGTFRLFLYCATVKILIQIQPMSNFSSVQFSCSVVSDSLWPHEPQHAKPPCPSPTLRVHPDQVQWVSDAIQPSHPLSSPQSFPASGSFQMSQLFASCGQSIRVSASASVLPMNIQDWSPLGWTGWISLQSKGLSRVFSNIIVQKHQFFSAHLSL